MDLNCELCANKKECFDNHWCVTMDRGRKINNEYVCDNFELSGRKYEELKEKNKKLEEEKDLFVKSYIKTRDDEANTVINSHRQLELLNKVIDMMAEDNSLLCTDYEFGCFYEENAECMKGPVRNCKDCIKEYYFKKARGVKYVFKNRTNLEYWNTRVIRKHIVWNHDEGTVTSGYIYEIHEVYYDKDGKIKLWSQNPIELYFNTRDGINDILRQINDALKRTVLEIDNIDGKDGEMVDSGKMLSEYEDEE